LAVGRLVSVASAAPARESYHWDNVRIGAGGFVTGIVFHPKAAGLAYARTDVGGAYRWEAATARWVPLLDWISRPDWNLMGVESLAVDPGDPRRVYLAVGTYTFPGASNGAILRSADQGRTWLRADLPFRLGGNETGRGNGERLAVDPLAPAIIYFGTRRDGLWRSRDAGEHWTKVPGFPDVPVSATEDPLTSWQGSPAQAVGIVCVQFDPRGAVAGQPTPTVYAAVSTRAVSLFVSHDAGASWQALAGQPTGLRPNHLVLSADGQLYISYGLDPGPNAMRDGAVWRLDPGKGSWTDITPIKPAATDQTFGYGAVAVDPAHPQTVMVATFCHWSPHDEIFRSTDGGRSWRPLLDSSTWDHTNAPWTRAMTPHWISCIAIDPFAADHVLFTTGYGIWAGANLTRTDAGERAHWTFADTGFEEIVPLDLISPPEGAHLLSAVADLDGFRHDDLGIAPPAFAAPPRFSNCTSIDFAGRAPRWVARVGMARHGGDQVNGGGWSDDGGATWTAFPAVPAGIRGSGAVAVAADGATLVWAPWGVVAHRSTDRGRTWTACQGLPAGAAIAADRADPLSFYGFDGQTGQAFASRDGGASFGPGATILAAASGRRSNDADLQAVADRPGDVWLGTDAGLFHSTDGAAHFSRIAGPDSAPAVGLGRAAPGRSYPAIFVAGTWGGESGLGRSDDAGLTWALITDAAHQFSAVSRLTGDPRVFGRVYLTTGGRGIITGEPATVPTRP
jgi:hypothetical protein